jgi:regulator of protease activity HflC (stomatin/prohibitin superfamily)
MESSLTDIFMNVAMYGAIAAGMYVTAKSALYTVKQRSVGLVTQFGKHVKTVTEPGLHMKAPFIQKLATLVSTAQFQTTNDVGVKTSDNLFPHLPVTIQWEISDPKRYHFDASKPLEQMSSLVDASVRRHNSGKTFQELFSGDRQVISDEVIADVGDHVKDELGITIRRIVIDQPKASAETRAAYEAVQNSAMKVQTAQNTGQAEYNLKVKEAEADKERDRLRGEGAALFRKAIFDQYNTQIEELVKGGTDREEAVDIMKTIMRFDMMREVGDKNHLTLIVADEDTRKGAAAMQAAAATRPPVTPPASHPTLN